MPRPDDYIKTNELDKLFTAMSDEEFRQYAADPDIDQKYLKFDQAQKTAFLNRALMLGENSDEFASDVKNNRNYVAEDGHEDVKKNVGNYRSINDTYSTAREFHYDIYRTILYKDDTVRPLATDITVNMSATNIVKNAEKLRGLLCSHLTMSTELVGSEKKEYLSSLEEDRKEFTGELGKGKYRVQKVAQQDVPAEDYQVDDPQGKFTIKIKVPDAGEDPESLLNGFDDPNTSAQEKRDKLFSYVLYGSDPVEVRKYITELRKNNGITRILNDYSSNMDSTAVKEDKKYLKSIIVDSTNSNLDALRISRKVYKVKNKGKEKEQKRILGNYVIESEAREQKKIQEKLEEDAKKEQAKKVTEILNGFLKAGRDIAADSKGRTWAEYADKHVPDELLEYSKEEKIKMLSKIMAGRRVQMVNGMHPENAVAFNLKTARQFAKDIRETPAFKAIVKSDKVDEYLKKDGIGISEATMGMVHPFNSMTFEQKKQMLEKLKEMAAYVDGPEGRSDKWVRFQRSVASLKNFKLENSNDPDKNGENKFEEIFNNAIDYMKGKKSLRKNEEQQNRFEQTLDFVSELGKGTEYAGLVADGLRDRITEVRRKHDPEAERVWDFYNGFEKIKNHGTKHEDIVEEPNVEDPSIQI